MKRAAIIALAVLIVCGGATLYLLETCRVTVTGIDVTAVDASSQPDLFNQLCIQVMENCIIGTKYSDVSALDSAENYQLLTYSVRLKNSSFVPAEMVEVMVTPMGDDVLQIGDSSAHRLSPQSEGTVSATILTGKGMHPVRELNVSYYIFGKPYRVRKVYGQK